MFWRHLWLLWLGVFGVAGCMAGPRERTDPDTPASGAGAAVATEVAKPGSPPTETEMAPRSRATDDTPSPARASDTGSSSRGIPLAAASPQASPRAKSTVGPDKAGYWPVPDSGQHWYPDYRPFGADAQSRFVGELQALLDAEDASGLAALIGGPDDGDAFVRFGVMDGTESSGDVPPGEMRLALLRLFAAGSQPVVQGWFAPPSDPHVPVKSMAVISCGWQGEFGFPDALHPDFGMPLPKNAGDCVTWQLAGSDDLWRWRHWGFPSVGYRELVDWVAGWIRPSEGTWLTYVVPRPDSYWPVENTRMNQQLDSPDGNWRAEVRLGEGQLIDPRDSRSWRAYRALVITDAQGNGRFLPQEAWDPDGFPGMYTRILGWTPDSRHLVFATFGVGDGCGVQVDYAVLQQDLLTGELEALPGGSGHRFDPEGYRLAYASRLPSLGTGPARMQLAVRDLRTAETVTTTLEADIVDSLTWSPAGDAVTLVFGFDVDICDGPARTGLARFDPSTGSLRVLGELMPGFQSIVAWREDGFLEVARGEARGLAADDRALVDAETGNRR